MNTHNICCYGESFCGYSLALAWLYTQHIFLWRTVGNYPLIQPPHDKTNKMICAPIEDSDQPGNKPSLIKVFRPF